MTVRLIKHDAVPGTGSFEVRFTDVRRSAHFHFDDAQSRRLCPGKCLASKRSAGQECSLGSRGAYFRERRQQAGPPANR